MVFGREGYLESESVGVFGFDGQVLVQSELNVGEVGHVDDVPHFFGVLRRALVDEFSAIAE